MTTKVFNPVSGDPADRGLSRDRIRRNVEGSLERLGVDRIDYYLAHDRDQETPLAETVGAFEELVAEGTIAAWGLSNHDAAAIRGGARVTAGPALVQNAYSLLDRDDEAERAAALRRARDRLRPVRAARRRLAHRQVPPRRDVPGRLADDDAPRALRASRRRPRLRRPRPARRRGGRARRRHGDARVRLGALAPRRHRAPSAGPPAPPISSRCSRRSSFRSRPRSASA